MFRHTLPSASGVRSGANRSRSLFSLLCAREAQPAHNLRAFAPLLIRNRQATSIPAAPVIPQGRSRTFRVQKGQRMAVAGLTNFSTNASPDRPSLPKHPHSRRRPKWLVITGVAVLAAVMVGIWFAGQNWPFR